MHISLRRDKEYDTFLVLRFLFRLIKIFSFFKKTRETEEKRKKGMLFREMFPKITGNAESEKIIGNTCIFKKIHAN